MRSKIFVFSVTWALAAAISATAQTVGRKLDFPADSPLTAVSSDWSETRQTPRGGAYLLDVHAVLSLRNTSQRRIRGVLWRCWHRK
jgi:hypothetical protein